MLYQRKFGSYRIFIRRGVLPQDGSVSEPLVAKRSLFVYNSSLVDQVTRCITSIFIVKGVYFAHRAVPANRVLSFTSPIEMLSRHRGTLNY